MKSLLLSFLLATSAFANQIPLLDAGLDRTAVVGQILNFDRGTSCDLDGSITTWHWDWNDGTQWTASPEASHAWMIAGSYLITFYGQDNGELWEIGRAHV